MLNCKSIKYLHNSPPRLYFPLCSFIVAIAILVGDFGSIAVAQTSPAEDGLVVAHQTAFRVRIQFDASLNAGTGWAGGLNESVVVEVDQPFRIRFELQSPAAEIGDLKFRLQCRCNGGAWANVTAEDFPLPRDSSPLVSIVSAAGYKQGEPTTDILSCSTAAYLAGFGVSLMPTVNGSFADSTVSSAENVQCEWEWPLVIRRFGDGAVTSNTGDRFEFRMTEAEGNRVAVESAASVTANVPSRHLGGTFVETPGRIGPWEASNGDLYFIMEPAETDNLLMIVKSEDRGLSWLEVDSANRPAADDLEGVASMIWGNTIHLLHQTSDDVWYHAFRMSDHDTHPDTWTIRDELVAKPEEPPVQVTAIAARSDGSLVGLYGGPAKVHFRVRSPEGIWSDEQVLDANEMQNLTGPQAVVGNGDVVHMAYTGRDGTAWYRKLQPDGFLTPRFRLADGLGTAEYDAGSILPLVFIPESDTIAVFYRLSDGHLWVRRSKAQGPFDQARRVTDRRVVQNAVDSDQTGADAIAEGRTIHVLFIDEETGGLYWTSADGDNDWSRSLLQISEIRGQWVRGTFINRRGAPAIGFVYDAGSDGGSGMNRFDTVPLTRR